MRPGPTWEEHAALADLVRALQREMSQLRGFDADDRLLLAIVQVVDIECGETFTAADICRLAEDDEDLAAALLPVVGLGRDTVRRLGKAFQRLHTHIGGETTRGLRIQKVGASRDGAIWQLMRV